MLISKGRNTISLYQIICQELPSSTHLTFTKHILVLFYWQRYHHTLNVVSILFTPKHSEHSCSQRKEATTLVWQKQCFCILYTSFYLISKSLMPTIDGDESGDVVTHCSGCDQEIDQCECNVILDNCHAINKYLQILIDFQGTLTNNLSPLIQSFSRTRNT